MSSACLPDVDIGVLRRWSRQKITTCCLLLLLLAITSVESWAQQCVNPACVTNSISLNTGYWHSTGTEYPFFALDAYWYVSTDPDPNTIEPRRADVMPAYMGWPTQPSSQWLMRDSINSYGGDSIAGTTTYATEFQVCGMGLVPVTFNLSVMAPDEGRVYLNGALLFVVPPPGIPPTAFIATINLPAGSTNILSVEVDNMGTAAGLNLVGTLSTPGADLITRECGPWKNGYRLKVFDDLDLNGVEDPGEPGLGGVTVDLSPPLGGLLSALTTPTGRVWFEADGSDGTALITVTPLAGYGITVGTTHSVTLAPGGWANGLRTGMSSCAQICVGKFNDLNCNGQLDAGEPTLSGWTINFSTGQQFQTIANTLVCRKVCTTGTVTVSEVIPPGSCWKQTYPSGSTTHVVTPIPGRSTTVLFGNSSTGTLCITKFDDKNANGVQDAGEPGLPNWSFTITSSLLLKNVVTGVNGTVCVPVTCGTYTVCEVMQAGWCPTTPTCQTVVVTACNVSTALFGNTKAGLLCVRKFNDVNCNGIEDPGEPPLAGWDFELTDPSGVVTTVTTDAAGMACTTATAGTWTICELVQPGWKPTTPGGVCQTVVVAACTDALVVFGNASTGTLCVTKFNDKNCNGVQDAGEPVLPGWTFTLTKGGTTINVVTDASGTTCATVQAGMWTVCELVQPGWKVTTPGGVCQNVLVSTCNTTSVLFGNASTGTLCVTKFNDKNCNGVQDAGEPVLPGWTFQLTRAGFAPINVVTDASGTTCATVYGGVWTVCEIVQAGWTPTTPVCRNVLVSTCNTTTVLFGNASTGTLCVTKFNDKNCNGVQDAGEPVLPGWTFQLTRAGFAPINVVTDASGTTCATVPGGVWTVCEIVQPGWMPTTPGGACQNVTVSTCNTTSVLFGNASTGTLCVTKFNDKNCNGVQDAGEPVLPGWTFTLTKGGTTINVITGVSGTTCATIPAGVWTVCEVTQAGWKATTWLCTTITVSTCQTAQVTFGNCSTGTVCGFKYNDLNGNGMQDAGEPAMSGWTIELLDNTGTTVLYNGVTDVTGLYCFENIPLGFYVMREVQKPGWQQTEPPPPFTSYVVEVTPCCFTIFSFGNQDTCSTKICITKFNDLDCDGVQGPSEPVLPGWTFTVSNGVTTISVTTGTTGVTCATVTAGTWTVCEVTRAGWEVTTWQCTTITVSTCQTVHVTFGNSSTGTVCGLKYNDLNGNGMQDAGELGMSGWTMELWDATGTTLLYSGVTDVTGLYCFQNIPLGFYVMREVQKPCWQQTEPPPPFTSYTVEVTPCCFTIFSFGNQDTCCKTQVCITKFNDKNCNGVQDAGEPMVPNWTFTLLNGATTISVTTGTTGVTCATVTAGTWTVCEAIPTCWAATTPGGTCQIVTVATCSTANVVFGNSSTGTLCVTKFNDKNCNGLQDPGEPGISGWQFSATSGTMTLLLTTGTNGTVCVPVTCGTWTVCEAIPSSCWVPTTPGGVCQTINIVPCAVGNVVFGNSSTGTLCVTKFDDLNGNGIQDSGELGIPGWQITISGVGTVTTATNGTVCVSVTCGTYTVCEVTRAGWTPTTPVCTTVTVTPCAVSNAKFGNRQGCTSGQICVTKFDDKNCNAIQDAGELLLPGWVMNVMIPGTGTIVATGVTGPGGTVCLTVPLGTYEVHEVLPPPSPQGCPWIQTYPPMVTGLPYHTVTVATCTVASVSFGNSSTGTLCVTKFNDKNCNGVQDPGELGIPGWQFSATSGTMALLLTTGTNGTVCVRVTCGTWILCEAIPSSCWVPTTPGGVCQTVGVAPCATTNVVFGNSSTGTLCVTKFDDLNGNGIQDPGEPGIPGWQITISGVGTVTTATNGTVCVSVTCGTYTVCEVTRAGWTPTTPVCTTVTITPCVVSKANFGNRRSCTGSQICVTKFDDKNCNGIQDPGELLLPGWTMNVTMPGGGPIVATGITGPGGTVCLNVPAGTFEVHEVIPPPTPPACPWVQTYPLSVTGLPFHTVTVVTCGSITSVSFGNSSTGTLCVIKFNDKNCNGIQDPGEPRIPGWQFSAVSGPMVLLLTTSTNGTVCVPVTCGTWTICEAIPSTCWIPTTPGGVCQTVNIAPCAFTPVVFGNSSTGTLCVTKFDDLNGNGVQDPGEPGIPGWQITISGVGTVTTATNGTVCVAVTCGTYTVCEVTRAGWTPTTPICTTVTVTPCKVANATFGNRMAQLCEATICGTKYWERPHGGDKCNGIIDPDEEGLWCWEIFAHDAGTGVLVTQATTAFDGSYCLTVPAPGTYVISEINKWGFLQTFPASMTYTLTVQCGDVINNVDFLNCACPDDQCITDSIPVVSDPGLPWGNTILTTDPSGGLVPRAGVVLMPPSIPSAPPVPGAQWIGPNSTPPLPPFPPGVDPAGLYTWARPFCVCESIDTTVVRVRLEFEGVDSVDVYLNGVLLGSYRYPAPPTVIDTLVKIPSGCDTLIFKVYKFPVPPGFPEPAGLSYIGSIVGPGLVDDLCCGCYTNNPHGIIAPPDDNDARDHATPGVSDSRAQSATDIQEHAIGWDDPHLKSVPNPTSGETTVYYRLAHRADIKLDLYTSVGAYVSTLEAKHREAGQHSVPLDLAELPSGLYHVRLIVDGRVYMLKIMHSK